MHWIRWFSEIDIDDVALVGGKNASLGEMRRELAGLGIPVPDGFAITAEAFREFLRANALAERIAGLLTERKKDDLTALEQCSDTVRQLMLTAALPNEISAEVVAAYRELSSRAGAANLEVAVRSSATA
ncbi:MAG: PEP/pyruvate-binding domain-containing protein, partial [Gemmatimonadaceae bacterium]